MAESDPVYTGGPVETRVNPRGTLARVRTVTPPVLGNDDVLFAVDAGGPNVFEVHRDGGIQTSYREDLTPGGSGAGGIVEPTATFTPPTSSTATLVFTLGPIGSQTFSFTATFATDADTTVNNLIALIAADPTMGALVVGTLVSHKLLITGKPDMGALGNQIGVATNGAHGAAISSATLVGGAGADATLNAVTGRVVFGGSQTLYSVLCSVVDPQSLVSPVVETLGQNLALGVLPFIGGFLLVNPSTPAQIQVAFSILT